MEVTQIPFNKLLGLQLEDGKLTLTENQQFLNHLGTVHASAQFALAEAASGQCLLENFSDLAADCIPVLRRAEVKYRSAATGPLSANANISDEESGVFRAQLTTKGRASLAIDVELRDQSGKVTLAAKMEWFVQRASAAVR